MASRYFGIAASMKSMLCWGLALAITLSGASAMAADVTLGAGDLVKVTVFNNPDLTLETRINEAGNISYPLIGEVGVGGMTTVEAEKKIAALLENGQYVKKPQVNMVVTSIQSQQVSVLGQVNRPGRYPVDSKRALIDVLAQAGGISPDGDEVVTLIRSRNGKTVKETVDLLTTMRGAEMKDNVELSGGDIVYVERAPRFYIYGEVQRPGGYRLDRNMTVIQALSVGGGLSPRGTERGIRIKRRNETGNIEVIEAKHDDLLKVDDVVYVKESLF